MQFKYNQWWSTHAMFLGVWDLYQQAGGCYERDFSGCIRMVHGCVHLTACTCVFTHEWAVHLLSQTLENKLGAEDGTLRTHPSSGLHTERTITRSHVTLLYG